MVDTPGSASGRSVVSSPTSPPNPQSTPCPKRQATPSIANASKAKQSQILPPHTVIANSTDGEDEVDWGEGSVSSHDLDGKEAGQVGDNGQEKEEGAERSKGIKRRALRTRKTNVNYNMNYHVIDDYINPRRQKRQRTEENIETDEPECSIRRSARLSTQKPVDYSAHRHPQDDQLPLLHPEHAINLARRRRKKSSLPERC